MATITIQNTQGILAPQMYTLNSSLQVPNNVDSQVDTQMLDADNNGELCTSPVETQVNDGGVLLSPTRLRSASSISMSKIPAHMSRGQILPAEGLSSGCLEQFGSTLTMTPIVVVDPSLLGDMGDVELNSTDVMHPSVTFKMEGVQFESTGVINPTFMVTEEDMDSESPHDSSDDNDNVFSDACCITSEDVSQMCHDHAATSPSSSCSSEEDQASDCVIIRDCALPVHGLTTDDTSSDSTIPFPEYNDQLAMELLALPDIALCMLMPIAPPVRPEGEDVFPSDDGWTMVNAEGEPVQVPLRQQRARGRCVRK